MGAKCCCRSPTRKCTERSAYLDLALIFLLFRFSLLILFFLHLALIALFHLWNKPDGDQRTRDEGLFRTEVKTWIMHWLHCLKF